MTITNPYYVSCEQWHPRDCFASLGWCYICRHNGHRLQECPFLGWGCYYYGGCRTCAASRRSPTLTHVCVWSIWGDKEFLADPPIFGHCQQRRVNPRAASHGGAWRRRAATVHTVPEVCLTLFCWCRRLSL